jgi:outer membrane protein
MRQAERCAGVWETLTRFCMAVALLILSGGGIAAEEVKQPGPLSLRECIAVAQQNNTDILSAQNDVTAARSRSAGAKSAYFPQVSLQNNTFSWGSQGVLNKVTTGTALTVSQNIFDAGLREVNVKSARFGVIQSTSGLTRTQQTISFDVSKAYYEVLRTRHLAEVAQANVKYNEGLRDQIQARASVGDAARVDVLPVEAQLAGARVSLLSAQNSVRMSAIELQSVMGLSPQPGFGILEVDVAPILEIESLDQFITPALTSRPDILQNQAAVGAARASVKSAKIALSPRPTISADYQRQVSGGFTTGGTQVVGGIVFDIFDGGANRAAYRESKASEATAELRALQIGKDIRAQVEEAYLALTNARERMAASSVSLEAANKNYLAQKERYDQGLGSTLDLLNAELQVVTAQSDDVQACYDYYIAAAQMDYAVGRQGGVYEK